MKQRKTTIFENGLIWFGAAVSIAEIMIGSTFVNVILTIIICMIADGIEKQIKRRKIK